jgi:putative tryptophan/tyrosine transport system substrate-binding protein
MPSEKPRAPGVSTYSPVSCTARMIFQLPLMLPNRPARGLQYNVMFGRRKEVAAVALAHRLPSIHSFTPEVEDGGLMSFGPTPDESYIRAAALAHAILKGANPADLPVEEPTQFTLAVNLKTAAALDITIPPAILVRADKVIE